MVGPQIDLQLCDRITLAGVQKVALVPLRSVAEGFGWRWAQGQKAREGQQMAFLCVHPVRT